MPERGPRLEGPFGEVRSPARGSYQWSPGPRVDPDTGAVVGQPKMRTVPERLMGIQSTQEEPSEQARKRP